MNNNNDYKHMHRVKRWKCPNFEAMKIRSAMCTKKKKLNIMIIKGEK